MIKWLLFALYGVILLAGTHAILKRNLPGKAPVLHAVKDLPANWLIQASDVDLPVPAGLYTLQELSKSAALTAENTRGLPVIRQQPGRFVVGVPVDPDFVRSGVMNAGRSAIFCKADALVAEKLTVAAVLCDPGGTQCVAFADLSAEQLQGLPGKPGVGGGTTPGLNKGDVAGSATVARPATFGCK